MLVFAIFLKNYKVRFWIFKIVKVLLLLLLILLLLFILLLVIIIITVNTALHLAYLRQILNQKTCSEKIAQMLFAITYRLNNSKKFFLQKFNILIEIWSLILSSTFLLQWYMQKDIAVASFRCVSCFLYHIVKQASHHQVYALLPMQ